MIEIKINKNDLEELFKNNSLTIDNLNIKLSCKEEKKFDYCDIKTFEDACKKLSLNPNDIVRLFDNFPSKHKKHLIAEYKLVLIFEAINDDWEADYNNDECKYYPYFIWDKSSGFSFHSSNCYLSDSYVSSLLSTNTREKSEYIGEQFIDIYDDFLNNNHYEQ